ncbi:LacI family DNA-binding transcriptional regulator [Rhizobium sp. YIM 134829]|uniref:LacI family DNA-binding transcriptional regulator n=1 Tax=Rhizobium sp. YIM 134829 TaxID=3390453 RepID=UPI00397A3CC3
MADVARAARVSPTTAARAIYNSGYVSEENRKRVMEAVEATGYRPNLQARSLRLQRTYTLGLILSSAKENPFYTHISHAIRTAASAAGFSMLTVNHSYSAEAEIAGIKQFLDHGVEAVILCHALDPRHLKPLIRSQVPIIQVERQDVEQAYSIAIDPLPGMVSAVRLLVEQGHQRIAFVGAKAPTAHEPSTPEQRRVDAFAIALEQCGLSVSDCPTVLGDYFPAAQDDDLPGFKLAEQLLSGPDARVTGIIAGSDILAAGILQAIYARGLRVPDDISIIGYDDSIAQFLSPPTSSIAQPYSAIGDAVVGFVEDVVADDAREIVREKRVTTALIARQSVGAAPKPRA